MSSRVVEILSTFSPTIEFCSINEAFLELSELKHMDLFKLGMDIRKTIGEFTGIPVTMGIAPTKTLCKMAKRYEKRKKKHIGVHHLADQQLIDEVLNFTQAGDIRGIGKQHEKFLLQHGIKTAAELAKANDEWIRKNMSVVGQRMVNELRGIPCIRWEDAPPAKKGICTSRSFGYLVTEREQLKEAVSNFASNVALKLRKQNNFLCA